MRVTRNALMRQCALCERTILLGERTVRFAPHEGDDFVDVCPLCQDLAVEHGWLKEGTPTSPVVGPERRRRRRGLVSTLFEPRRQASAEPLAPAPILRRLSDRELAMVEAADLFNASPHRRTVGGIAKSLGLPRASIVPLGGLTGELVLTIAWDISWYQYRVTPESAQPVRLEERGHELDDLDESFRAWNARVEDEGRLVPQIANL
jgi:cytochrome P450